MRVIEDVEALREQVGAWRRAGERVGFVPTMGNLHRGHLVLVERAHQLCTHVVTSIFVNPTQFGPTEDFDRYPRTFEADCAKLREVQCDMVFAPSVASVYPFGPEQATRISVPVVSDVLCGAVDARPGHFTGVAGVVLRLFNLVAPDVACFGDKDFQQLVVIRRMVRDLGLAIRIEGVATVREADGLAMSSRNQYLLGDQRQRAAAIWQTLQEMRQSRLAGEAVAPIEARAKDQLAALGFLVDYASLRNSDDLGAAGDPRAGGEIALIAARLGNTRLIDNLQI